MNYEMKRVNRELSTEETLNIISKGQYGVMACVGSDLEPYGVPLSYVLYNGSVYFHCASQGHKIDNIKHNPMVSFVVVGETNPVLEKDTLNFSTYYESAIIFGNVSEVVEDIEKIGALRALCDKYLHNHMDKFEYAIKRSLKITKVYKINFCKLSGKAKRP
ncbi:MAG: pyridoxamine 5'-phosphate oxidase family protein [Bacilli bacterium]